MIWYAENKKLPADIICSFAQDEEKRVRDALVDILGQAKGYEKNVREMLVSKEAEEREVAVKVLAKWARKPSGEKYVPILKEALEKETSKKIRTLLVGIIPMNVQEPTKDDTEPSKEQKELTREDKEPSKEQKEPAKEDKEPSKEQKKPAKEDKKPSPDINIVKELHKGNKKRSLAWAYETPFPKVHNKTGEEADEEYLQAIFLAYAAMSLKDIMVSEDDVEAGKMVLKSGGPVFVNSVAASLHGNADITEDI